MSGVHKNKKVDIGPVYTRVKKVEAKLDTDLVYTRRKNLDISPVNTQLKRYT